MRRVAGAEGGDGGDLRVESGERRGGGGVVGAGGVPVSSTVSTTTSYDDAQGRPGTVSAATAHLEAVAKANNTPYGLSAGIWTEKGSRILWMADQLRAGVVWANTFNKFDPTSPFGGYKESGYGREGGLPGLAAYLKGADA